VFAIGPASSSANGTVRPKTGPYRSKRYRAVPGSRSYRNSVYSRTHGTVRRARTAVLLSVVCSMNAGVVHVCVPPAA
jgi:hypothetical protein